MTHPPPPPKDIARLVDLMLQSEQRNATRHAEILSGLASHGSRLDDLERVVGKGGPSLPPGGVTARARANSQAFSDFEAWARAELARQTAWMGIGRGALSWLTSPEGAKVMLQLAAFAAATAAALR